MNKSMMFFLGSLLLFAVAAPLHAQSGCTDSPENPTAVLAVVGGIGVLDIAHKGRAGPLRDCTWRSPAGCYLCCAVEKFQRRFSLTTAAFGSPFCLPGRWFAEFHMRPARL